MSDATIYYTKFKSANDTTPKECSTTWPNLAGALTKFTIQGHKGGALWSPCRYLPNATRAAANVAEVFCLVLDIDDGTKPEELESRWGSLEYVIHSTFHNGQEKRAGAETEPACCRWRAVFPLAHPIPAENWSETYKAAAGALAGEHWCKSCSDPSRMFYPPIAPATTGAFSRRHAGALLDVATITKTAAPVTAPRTAATTAPAQLIPVAVNDEELLPLMFASRSGPAIQRLWSGDTSDHRGDDSAADQALCNYLAFWCNRDTAQMDRLFRRSGLYRRPGRPEKWDKKHYSDGTAYGAHTIQTAIDSTPEGYTPSTRRNKQPGASATGEQPAGEPADKPNLKGRSQATLLVDMALNEGAELFHTPEKECYANIRVDGHRETIPISSSAFRDWLGMLFYREKQQTPSSGSTQDAIGVLSGCARYEAPMCEAHLRFGVASDGAVYYDLGDAKHRAVKVTARGWEVVPEAPIYFRRPAGMLSLPDPVHGGSFTELRDFINVKDDDEWALLAGFAVELANPSGPYPIAIITGEQGAAKSTATRILRRILDPSKAELRATPKDIHDLAIMARNNWIIALDNISSIPPWLSDALCRLATGQGMSTRKLYTDSEEAIFEAQRPIILNGIGEIASRSDLIDRGLMLQLRGIPEEKRRPEKEFWGAFEQAWPRLLGALFDAVSTAFQRFPDARPQRPPRMADFAWWVNAAEPALGLNNGVHFLDVYSENRKGANAIAIEASPVASAIQNLVNSRGGVWEGTISELLGELPKRADEKVVNSKAWPTGPRSLSTHLERCAPNLRAVGYDIVKSRQAGTGKAYVAIKKCEAKCEDSVRQNGACEAKSGAQNDLPHTNTPSNDAISATSVRQNGICEAKIPTSSVGKQKEEKRGEVKKDDIENIVNFASQSSQSSQAKKEERDL